ncbi:hypothetical protein F4780DRAFT_346502 [Xylariomycetidae sp. FL0641]|nr:hypothetical protein F4780DRAFT_346502 [Xylariomycetidae sp. FL0641]
MLASSSAAVFQGADIPIGPGLCLRLHCRGFLSAHHTLHNPIAAAYVLTVLTACVRWYAVIVARLATRIGELRPRPSAASIRGNVGEDDYLHVHCFSLLRTAIFFRRTWPSRASNSWSVLNMSNCAGVMKSYRTHLGMRMAQSSRACLPQCQHDQPSAC